MKYREMAGEKISVLGFGCKTLMPKNQQKYLNTLLKTV